MFLLTQTSRSRLLSHVRTRTSSHAPSLNNKSSFSFCFVYAYLIFYRMAGPIIRDETGTPWCVYYWPTGFTPPSPLVSSLGEMSTGTSPSPDGTGADRQGKFYIFPTDGHRAVEQTPRSAPTHLPPFALAEQHKPFERLTNSMPNLPTRAVGPIQHRRPSSAPMRYPVLRSI